MSKVCLFLVAITLALGGCRPATAIPTRSAPPVTPPATATPEPSATAASTATLPPTRRPTSTPFPTFATYNQTPEQADDGWLVGSPSAAGLDGRKLSEMLAAIYHGKERGDTLESMYGGKKMQNIHGILIARQGKLVFEEYFYHYNRTNRHNTASVSKSITSLLVGLAIEQGYLEGVEQPVLPFFEQYQVQLTPDALREQITVENLLTMRHGLACDDWVKGSPTYWKNNRTYEEPDMVVYTLNMPMELPPGEHFSYCSNATIVLGGVLAKATGMSVPQFSKQALFAPLGITSYGWMSVNGGWTDTGGSLQMRMRDMLKIGQMALQGGVWQGRQIVPQAWIEQSAGEHVELELNGWGSGYGYLWWLSDVTVNRQVVHSFTASGAGGQVITVYPDLEMVVVITGWNIEPDNGEPFQIMEKWILPAAVKK